MLIKEKFQTAIAAAQNIVITTHLYPDADGIGSQISLCLALRELGKNVICCNQEELLPRYKYLDTDNVVIGVDRLAKHISEKIDLIVIVDTNIITRAGVKLQKLAKDHACPLLYIDHHPCPEEKLSLPTHCIDTTTAATGQLVGNLISDLGIAFTKKTALPLYTAILIDTSSFRYPTVTASTHELVSKLMKTGIEPPSAYNGIYGTKKIEYMHLLGEVLKTADATENEEIAWIVLSKVLIDELQVDLEDTHSFINNLLVLDHVKVACMFREDDDQLKVSLRSSGLYDVGNIAISLGGGGHSHSAATIIPKEDGKSLDDMIQETVSNIIKCLD